MHDHGRDWRGAVIVVPPDDQRPICGQCRRDLVGDPGTGWRHHDDLTPTCPPGAYEAMRAIAALVTGCWPSYWVKKARVDHASRASVPAARLTAPQPGEAAPDGA